MDAQQLCFDGRVVKSYTVELAPPQGAQVLLRSEYSNVSIGTEIACIRHARPEASPLWGLGYATVGTVEAVGLEACYRSGQRVFAQPGHAAASLVDGSAGALTPVPDGLDPVVATLVALIGVGLHAVQRARVNLNECAVVYGHGLVGAFAAQLLRRAGAGQVVVVDPDPVRQALAQRLGATRALGPEAAELRGVLEELGHPDGADLVIEAAGHPSVFPRVFEALRIGGRLVCTSTFLSGLDVTLYPVVIEKELTLIGAHGPKCPPRRVPYYPYSQSGNRGLAMDMLADGSLQTGGLITRCVAWQEAPALYEELEGGHAILGAVIDWRDGTGIEA